MRKRLFQIIEVDNIGDRLSRVYDIFMMAVILISLLPLCFKETTALTQAIDIIAAVIFIADYLFRLATADYKYPALGKLAYMRYPFSTMAIIDLISILPSFGFFSHGLRLLKIVRLLRTFKVLRVIKFVRYSKSIGVIFSVMKKQKEALTIVAGLACGYILISALIIFNVEPDSFDTFFDAVYWACVSLTTVGYGDIYPTTNAGRIVTMISSIMGIAIVALPSGIITAGYLDEIRKTDNQKQ